ncbi:MAG: DUF3575 domain-containing protein [Bacteroidota bacterium]
MKNFIQTISFIFALTLSLPLSAQQSSIKFIPGKILWGPRQLSFSFERAITDKLSANFGFSGMIPINLTNGALTVDSTTFATDNFTIGDGSIGGMTITPALRFYPGGRAIRGFYIEPFLRYFRYALRGNGVYQDFVAGNSDVDVRYRFQGFGLGGALGYQWVISDVITIEWLGGFGVAFSGINVRGDVSGPLENDVDQFIADLNEQLEGLPVVNQVAQSNTGGTDIQIGIPGITWPILRSSLAIGFAF